MALLQFWSSNRDGVLSQTIRQIVNNAGDGRLLDASECCRELRHFLGQVPSEHLFNYALYCLDNDFEQKGFVLQDVINELGRRLDFRVEDGRYQGVRGQVGFDGAWRREGTGDIVVEVKTTDRYLIDLDTLAGYRTRLQQEGRVGQDSSLLIVVGRNDTGGLEAQVRGSRHAWDIRLISIESLIKLVRLKEKSSDPSTTERIREVLRPFEYTRVDRIIDLVFTAAEDVEQSEDEAADATAAIEAAPETEGRSGRTRERTPRAELEARRQKATDGLSRKLECPLRQSTRTLFWSEDRKTRVCVAVSKRYEDLESQPYWYAFHPPWNKFLAEGERSFVVLAAMDSEVAYAIPYDVFAAQLSKLNQTVNGDRHYWHVALAPMGEGMALNLSKAKEKLDLRPYAISIAT